MAGPRIRHDLSRVAGPGSPARPSGHSALGPVDPAATRGVGLRNVWPVRAGRVSSKGRSRWRRWRRERSSAGANPGKPGELHREERQLRWALIAGAVLFALEAAIYIPEVFRGPAATRPFAINSVAKDVLFGLIAAAVALDLRRRVRLLWLLILGHLVIVTLLLLAIVTGDTAFSFPPPRWLAVAAPVHRSLA